ncbi:AAA family ATPase [Aliidiomarina minuta]|uniref:AAA family ATPase n=1 Tax=Aliidiomarina minuta TaxID=880057 RepID=A0A432W9G5_9GAMM|nr:AAA family ATPase [Aliidiomarina minuta]RUO26685.1 AAA family ATPase [Aliidiomarina minuta]
MYLYHYGMHELPFTLTPNTSFYCGLHGHDEALEVLLTALKTGEGFIKVTGEVGTGKTLLCRKLLNELPDHFVTAYVPNPYLTPGELRQAVAMELGVGRASLADQQQLTHQLEQQLLEINRRGRTVVLILDEAQALPQESLEALRLLSNLETESRKLVHLVLFGQPELDERLAGKDLRQLRQRIGFSYKLQALTEDQVAHYVSHRLHVAGYKGPALFSRRGLKLLHKASRGVPRLVNVLCHKSLMLGYGMGKHSIDHKMVRAAVRDTEDASPTGLSHQWWLAAGVVFAGGLASAAWALGWSGS